MVSWHFRAGISLRTGLWILAERRLLLPCDENRLGAVFSGQQGVAVLLSARGSRLHSADRPHAAVVGLRTGRRRQSLLRHAAGRLAASLCNAVRGFRCRQSRVTAAGIRWFIKSPFHLLSLREAILFVLIAVIVVPVGAAFWGAAFTVANNFGTDYWVEWRNLGISNGVTTIVLVPAILIGIHQLSRKVPGSRPGEFWKLRAGELPRCGRLARLRSFACGADHFARAHVRTASAAHLGRTPFWTWRRECLRAGHHDPGYRGNDAWARSVPDADPRRKMRWPCNCSS